MIKKRLKYNYGSCKNAKSRCILILGIFSFLPIFSCTNVKNIIIILPFILLIVFCTIELTKLLTEKKFLDEISDFVKNNGKKYNGIVVKSEKVMNWFGSNVYPFKYVLIVQCEKGVFRIGDFINDPIKKLDNLTVDVYILEEYVYICDFKWINKPCK